MTNLNSHIAENIHFLEQGIGLLTDMSNATYTKTIPAYFSSNVGKHVRHILDHYANFIQGLSDRRIDYDARERGTPIEKNREVAITRHREIIAALRELTLMGDDPTVQVRLNESRPTDTVSAWTSSTIERELQYLLSHTVHHYALIAMILRLQQIEVPESFGVAPSTLQYQQAQTENRA